MNRVLISVEGQTEETFVREVLAPHLLGFEVVVIPVLISTKIVSNGPNFKGGLTSYAKVKSEVLRLLGDTAVVAVTTMYDLYGLPTDFPGYGDGALPNCYERVEYLEAALLEDIGRRRFHPYLQLHEFEALLFVDPEQTSRQFPGIGQLETVRSIRDSFSSPEEIDDGPTTAPSKRLLAIFPGYQKPLHGPLITMATGLDLTRAECPHFNSWLEWLEGLGS